VLRLEAAHLTLQDGLQDKAQAASGPAQEMHRRVKHMYDYPNSVV
jgi:hypothetical protein